jgi:hypothetical protein
MRRKKIQSKYYTMEWHIPAHRDLPYGMRGSAVNVYSSGYWHAKPNPSQVSFVNVVMVEITSFGVTFAPTSFTLYNPAPDSQM